MDDRTVPQDDETTGSDAVPDDAPVDAGTGPDEAELDPSETDVTGDDEERFDAG